LEIKRVELKMRGNHFGELSAFVAVAEKASFTNAARRHGLSTATLSQTVRALETRLGVRLLNRTTRSVAPTDTGERLLSQLRPLLDGFDAAIESVNAFREKPAGHLRLTMPPPVARFVLASVLARFSRLYPEIVIEATGRIWLHRHRHRPLRRRLPSRKSGRARHDRDTRVERYALSRGRVAGLSGAPRLATDASRLICAQLHSLSPARRWIHPLDVCR
jgi:hypothetical protein